jgi:hypothetical protein
MKFNFSLKLLIPSCKIQNQQIFSHVKYIYQNKFINEFLHSFFSENFGGSEVFGGQSSSCGNDYQDQSQSFNLQQVKDKIIFY